MPRVFWAAADLATIAGVVWLLFGFMAWQWDPEDWTKAGRGAAVVFWLALHVSCKKLLRGGVR